jgi:hypothetical protein
MGASRAVILSPSATSESKDGKPDERGLDTSVVFIYQAISMANPSIHIVCEMVSPGSVPFLCIEKHAAKRTGDPDFDDLMFSTPFQQPYVTGNVGTLLVKSLLFPRFWSAILAMSILLVVVVVVVVDDDDDVVVVDVAFVVVVVIGIVVAACVALFARTSLPDRNQQHTFFIRTSLFTGLLLQQGYGSPCMSGILQQASHHNFAGARRP